MQSVAVVLGAFLSGAMMSCSILTVPVLLDTNAKAAKLVSQWARMYHYGQMIMPTMAIATFLLYGVACVKDFAAEEPWIRSAIAAAVTIGIVPFTFGIMLPTNNKLFRLDATSADSSPSLSEVRGLVTKWQLLHVTRSLLPLVGALIATTSLFA